MAKGDEKRLFFGFEAHAPWPHFLPKARLLKEEDRHLTVAFLGNTSYSKICALIPRLPKPPFRVAPIGMTDVCLCLPERHPSAIAWHVHPFWQDPLADYQLELVNFLRQEGYNMDEREFLKHITLGRSPFDEGEWRKEFRPLPLYFAPFQLYESFQGLKYEPIWTHTLLPPFEEIEHAADIAFKIYGESVEQLYINSQIALAFRCPELLPYLNPNGKIEQIEEGIIALNDIITQADQEIGIPFKAVSFHGNVIEKEQILAWEMIVDV